MIKYPTDLDLISDSREQSERLIDQLAKLLKLSKKPRTYRQNARRELFECRKEEEKEQKSALQGHLANN